MDIDRAFELVLERIAIQANRRYMEALSRIYQVDIRTVYIWHATGRA
ncbi:hypothetical protein SEA_ZENITSU_41 [Microbacterium phage Zenitsu]|uniref:Uncharacterized protein n=1 Tax=Microbacterium phage MCubed TaxID=2593339 RepID=A0A514U409_9CAUD|nr:hypothetical protein SEA_MCUBED_41 [Microbacterium phage MCubed]WNN93842.1 hypothetical protein SEA_ZENITSU_41 [Microbacterium phage Zenitsu]